MMTEERSGMMMMVAPNQIFNQETNHLYGDCFPSIIRKFTKLTSNVCKGILDDWWGVVNEVDVNLFFEGRQQ